MGASWRPGAAALLLVLAAALSAPLAPAGSQAAPELSDPAGDQEVDTGTVPILPGVNEDAFDDIDLVAAWLEERTTDCVGEPAGTCPTVQLVVQTTAAWRPDGVLTIGFTVERGPTSLPQSTATAAGRAFLLNVTGTSVSGLDNATAASSADGLRVTMPLPRLGAVGGDVLSSLTLAASRFSDGTLQDLPFDDQTGSDAAGPGADYTFSRPPVSARMLLEVVSVGGKAGSATTLSSRDPVEVALRVTNLGLDADSWSLAVSSQPPLEDPPVFAQVLTPIAPGGVGNATVPVSLEGMDDGLVTLTFTLTSELGARATATARLTLDLPSSPPADREVKPEGLTFLTGPAEATGLDGPFGSYAELALLALLVLVVLVVLFLLLALGRTTLDTAPTPEAPWPDEPAPAAGRRARGGVAVGPGGIAETVRASDAAPAALFRHAEPEHDGVLVIPPADEPAPEVDAAALAAALAPESDPSAARPAPAALPVARGAAAPRIRIEEVRHSPAEPDAGQQVTTEVLLRNEGATASLRVTLTVDGKPAAERTVQVPSRATKAVELPWTAGPGDNRVRIQAFPA